MRLPKIARTLLVGLTFSQCFLGGFEARLVTERVLVLSHVQQGLAKKTGKKKQSSEKPRRDFESWRAEGKRHYKDRDYTSAQRTFIKLVQHNSTHYSDYLLLARSANRAEDYLISSVAYQIYFESKTGRLDRQAKAEHEEVRRHLSGGVDKRKRKAHKARVNEVLLLIKKGEIFGKRGALIALSDIHRERIFDPLLQRAHKKIAQRLLGDREKRLKSALLGDSADKMSLDQYAKGMQRWGRSSWGDIEVANQEILALEAFSMVNRSPKEALKALEKLVKANYKVSPELLRSAQFLVISKLNRHEEVYLMTDGLIGSLEGRLYGESGSQLELERLRVLRAIKGVYGRALKKEEANESLTQALLTTPSKIKALLKREASRGRMLPKVPPAQDSQQ